MASKIKVDNITNQSDSNIVNKCSTTITVGTGSDTTNVPGAAVVTGNITGAEITSSSNVVKSNAYQASDAGNIINQCGTTITIGASGDTVSLASGASQTGFGREGSVDWQTSIKTSDFTAVSGEGYFVNTTSGGVTVTLPASPSAGAIVAIKDYANTADTNAILIARNGSNIQGVANDWRMETEGLAMTLVYADATKGWLGVAESKASDIAENKLYITATGGTVTCSGDYKIHTFTGPGTFTVSCAGNSAGNNKLSYMVVAGGGGGTGPMSGGGGAGGFREGKDTNDPYSASPLNAPDGLTVSVQAYPVTVGGGGTGWNVPSPNTSGSNSVFSTITSAGGGSSPADGGSGNGGPRNGPASGGSGNTPPVSPPQGNPGGGNGGGNANDNGGGGGGGAGAAGAQIPSSVPFPAIKGGNGGNGVTTSINASPVTRGGGGGGGHRQQGTIQPNGNFASGGSGGGGRSGYTTGPGSGNVVVATDGTANTGGGGGSPVYSACNPPGPHICNPATDRENAAGDGGSGIVIVRYKYQN